MSLYRSQITDTFGDERRITTATYRLDNGLVVEVFLVVVPEAVA